MKIKLFISGILILLLSVNVNAQQRYKKKQPPVKVVQVYHPVVEKHYYPKRHKKVRYVKPVRRVVHTNRVVYVNRPAVDVYLHKPGRINVGVRVAGY